MRMFLERVSWLAFAAGVAIGGLAVFVLSRMEHGPAETGTTLATVGGERITVEEFTRMAELRSGASGAGFDKHALLDEMVFHKALVARARAEGLERKAEFRQGVENLLVGKIRQKHRDAAREPGVAQVKALYEETKDRYEESERRRLAMIFLEAEMRSGSDTGALRSKLDEVRKNVAAAKDDQEAGATWTQAAARMSSDRASRYRGGEIGWFGAGMEYRTDPAVIAAGFALDGPGDVSGIVEGKDGLYLVKLLDGKPGGHRPFESVKEEVRHRLIRERQKEAEAEFRKETFEAVEVQIRNEILDNIELLTRDRPGPNFPQGGH